MQSEYQMIDGYDTWICKWLAEGREVYFLTIQCHHLGAGKGTKAVMEAEIGKFYSRLLTRIIQNPTRKCAADRLPILIAVPDLPVSKHNSTYRLSEVRQNDGLHYHALLAIHPENRLKMSVCDHMKQNKHLYSGIGRSISDIHIVPVTHAGTLADYMFKHIKRRSFGLDDVLVFPRARSELT